MMDLVMMGEGSGGGANLVLYLSFLSLFQSIDLRSCLCYVISAVCVWVYVLWVLISLCSFRLISVCPFGC